MYKVVGPGSGISTYAVEGDENTEGYPSISMPGTTGGLCLAHKLMGKLPLEQVMEPAIHLAQEGFEVYWVHSLWVATAMEALNRFPGARKAFLPGGFPPKYIPDPSSSDTAATGLVQRDLADMLNRIARNGAPALYEGEVAVAIEEDMKRNGGLITAEDLARFKPEVKSPLRTTYRDFEVMAPTAPCGTWTTLETLNILENFDLKSMDHNSAEEIHIFVEAARHAFADRYAYMGDPDFVDVPLKALLSREYAKEVAAQVDTERAVIENAIDIAPWAHYETNPIHEPWKFEGRTAPTPPLSSSATTEGDCTTHFCVVDRDGNLISCTQTAVSSFGSKVVTDGLGFIWNNGMIWFNAKPGAANSVAPWKRPLVNMAPVLVTKDGDSYLGVGSPGGRKVNNGNTNVTLNVLEFEMGPQEAITVPRSDASGPTTLLDARLDRETVDKLRQMGHKVEVVSDLAGWYSFSKPTAILVDREQGLFYGGSDPWPVADAQGF
jgi:gamma-glutamyltranspeptidase/glutathione hydrolase